MKPYSLRLAVAIGISVWGCYRGVAQPLLLSAPIMIQVKGVDHRHVMNPHGRVVDGKVVILLDGEVGVVLKDTPQSEVEALVRYGLLSHCPVCLVDGPKLIASCHVVGEARAVGGGSVFTEVDEFGEMRFGERAAPEYGFLLRFSSVQEADRVALLMKSEPPISKQELEELIRSHKHDLDDQRFWRAQKRSNTALEPLE
jgi:hypothetical protein